MELAACKYNGLIEGDSFDEIYEECNDDYQYYVTSRSETRGCPQ